MRFGKLGIVFANAGIAKATPLGQTSTEAIIFRALRAPSVAKVDHHG